MEACIIDIDFNFLFWKMFYHAYYQSYYAENSIKISKIACILVQWADWNNIRMVRFVFQNQKAILRVSS